MIRYPMDLDLISSEIKAIDARWLDKTKARTATFVANKKFEEKSSIWHVVKPVYMLLQNNKCVFCERQFESVDYGKIEFDLEHFRPKSSVKAWPLERHRYRYDFKTGSDGETGYYWLAYELTNYAACCKVCNSNLKSDFFPIAGRRCTIPGPLTGEKPFLCYPLGEEDDDPEALVTFIATTAVPVAKTGYKQKRGQIIIDFFDLNLREQLHRQRAQMIILLGNSLAAVDAGKDDDSDAQIIAQLLNGRLPHSACARAFYKSWNDDLAFGRKILKACKTYFSSEMGAPAPNVTRGD